MENILIGAGCLACALMAVREKRLLVAALWLAFTSALVAWIMYRLGAMEVAVVELSVGAGLVTVLFVFAINIAGDEPESQKSIVPHPLAWIVMAIGVALLGWMILPAMQLDRFLTTLSFPAGSIEDFRQMVWNDRGMDTMLQVVLIFAGVMAVLSFLGHKPENTKEEEL
jgi:NADH:ubiquinone oxidoreductase subunit 6 (subunit J)